MVFLLALEDLPVELVDERVDRGVEVVVGGVGEHVTALDVDGGLGLLHVLLDFEDDVDVGDVFEVSFELRELLERVLRIESVTSR